MYQTHFNSLFSNVAATERHQMHKYNSCGFCPISEYLLEIEFNPRLDSVQSTLTILIYV